MGSPKQILPWKGTHLLDHTIDNAKAVFGEGIVVVLGANANEIKSASTQEGVRYILNKNWRTGLGSSIAHGYQIYLIVYDLTLYSLFPYGARGFLLALLDRILIRDRVTIYR